MDIQKENKYEQQLPIYAKQIVLENIKANHGQVRTVILHKPVVKAICSRDCEYKAYSTSKQCLTLESVLKL